MSRARSLPRSISFLILGVLALAPLGRAQSERRVPVRVSAVSGNAIFLDLGREAGLESGDRVILRPRGRQSFSTRLTIVSRTSARAEFPAGVRPPDIGTDGEVLVPESRFSAPPTTTEAEVPPPEAPEHPPWDEPLPNVDESIPLLAPIDRVKPEERPSRVSGLLFTRADLSENDGETYSLFEAGLETVWENPFGQGGTLSFRGVGTIWPQSIFEGGNDDDSDLRLELFSYRSNDAPEQTLVWEVGRFLPVELPELGWNDGANVEVRLGESQVIGVGGGFLPDPFDMDFSDDDLQVFAYHGVRLGEAEEFRFTWGYQRTWHEGSSDRDLFLGVLDWRPSEALSLHGTVWVDYYGSDANFKDRGLELTEAHVSGTYLFDEGTGVRLGYSSIRWPELERTEFLGASNELIANGHLQRVFASAFRDFGEFVRVDGRINHWDDRHDSGTGGDLQVALQDLLWDRGELALTVFHNEGAYQEGTGARLRAFKSWPDFQIAGSYEIQNQELDLTGKDLVLQALSADLSWFLSDSVDLSLFVDRRFGDEQDAWTVSLFTQFRF